MKIFNTLSLKKEEFVPLTKGEYRIYVCGPTVYNFIHVGNARPLCVFDTLRRYLEYCGNKVVFVQNVTDIDDKLIKRAMQENTTVSELAKRYETEYLTDCKGLNVAPPTVMPRATEHIPEMIQLITELLEKEHAYVSGGDVYFRTKSFEQYGKLCHQPMEALEDGARVAEGEVKENATDFALWKGAKEGEPSWEAPFGNGRPGWHIECSAMSKKHLGDSFDLHCGGQDLIFPHHENEIAQSEAANGKPFATYWMHNGFLNIDNRKMSKSANNFFMVRDVVAEYGYEPIRYLMLSAVYRTPLNFTREIMEQCKAALERLYSCKKSLEFTIENGAVGGVPDRQLLQAAAKAQQAFNTAMDDDLNTPEALAAVFELTKAINSALNTADVESLKAAQKVFLLLTSVLGILYIQEENPNEQAQKLLLQRNEAKNNKDFAKADTLRDTLLQMGYKIEDRREGSLLVRE